MLPLNKGNEASILEYFYLCFYQFHISKILYAILAFVFYRKSNTGKNLSRASLVFLCFLYRQHNQNQDLQKILSSHPSIDAQSATLKYNTLDRYESEAIASSNLYNHALCTLSSRLFVCIIIFFYY